MITKVAKIKEKLEVSLVPEFLEVIDESHLHEDHKGFMENGSHFFVRIRSKNLSSLARVQAHQGIYRALADMMNTEIHALRIEILS